MTASWSAAYAPHGSPVSSGPADRPALRWSIAIIRYCPAYAVSGLIAAISPSGTLERIPPGASVSMGNPVPCSVYQILAPPLSTYGTPVSSPDTDSVTQPTAGPPLRLPATAGRRHRPAATTLPQGFLPLPACPSRCRPSARYAEQAREQTMLATSPR